MAHARTHLAASRYLIALTGLVLVLGACGGGAGPSTAPAGGGSPASPAPVSQAPAATTAPATTVSPTDSARHNGRLAYGVRAADGSANIFSALPDGTDVRQLTTGAGRHLCAAYSADGNQIAYCADTGGNFEIWTMQPDGTQQAQVTHFGGTALFPDFSPDGSKIVFGGTEGDDPNTEIYVVDAATGTGLVALTSCAKGKAGCANDYPRWSPDGRQIAFVHQDDYANDVGVNQQVWLMNADGSNQHPLTTGTDPHDAPPAWSPDGTRIAYTSGTPSNETVWVMAADGSSPHQLSGCHAGDPSPCAAGDDFGPKWSPDGAKIAFLRGFTDVGKDDRAIYVMNADGTDQVRLTPGAILQAIPAWQSRGAGEGA